MKNKTINMIFAVLIFWQFYGWFEFVPVEGVDPYNSLAKMFYFLWFFPVAIIGVIISLIAIKKKIGVKKSNVITAWILLTVSVCTAIPPIFKIARYIFYPIVMWLE